MWHPSQTSINERASLAGDDQVFGAAFRPPDHRLGARDYENMFGLARSISKQPQQYSGWGFHHLPAPDRWGSSPHLKNRLRRLLPYYVCGMNPVDYTFSQDAETVKRTMEIGVDSDDVGSFIVVLQAEIPENYVDTLKKIDYKGKPIIACVAGKEFPLELPHPFTCNLAVISRIWCFGIATIKAIPFALLTIKPLRPVWRH